jgi:hypothetical protein
LFSFFETVTWPRAKALQLQELAGSSGNVHAGGGVFGGSAVQAAVEFEVVIGSSG